MSACSPSSRRRAGIRSELGEHADKERDSNFSHDASGNLQSSAREITGVATPAGAWISAANATAATFDIGQYFHAVIPGLKTLEERADKYVEKPVSAFVNHLIRCGFIGLTSTFDAESVVQLQPLRFSVQDTIDRLCEASSKTVSHS